MLDTPTMVKQHGGPSVAVAVVELAGGEALERCIWAVSELVSAEAQVLLVLRGEHGPPPPPGVEVVRCGGETVPHRRAAAVAATTAEVVVLVEDTTRPSEGWLDTVVSAFGDGRVVAASGPVDIARALPARYRALAMLEYGQFFAPDADTARDATVLAGNCMAFRRAALDWIGESGLVEHQAVHEFTRNGGRVLFLPGMVSHYAWPCRYSVRLRTRFAHGRLYSARERRRRTLPGRMAEAARALLVPPVLTLRALRHALRRPEPARIASEVAWIAVMASAWGLGEAAGSLLGEGDSARSWR